jgi:hypothetical protein
MPKLWVDLTGASTTSFCRHLEVFMMLQSTNCLKQRPGLRQGFHAGKTNMNVFLFFCFKRIYSTVRSNTTKNTLRDQ